MGPKNASLRWRCLRQRFTAYRASRCKSWSSEKSSQSSNSSFLSWTSWHRNRNRIRNRATANEKKSAAKKKSFSPLEFFILASTSTELMSDLTKAGSTFDDDVNGWRRSTFDVRRRRRRLTTTDDDVWRWRRCKHRRFRRPQLSSSIKEKPLALASGQLTFVVVGYFTIGLNGCGFKAHF